MIAPTSLGLTGEETYSIAGLAAGLTPRQRLRVRAEGADGAKTFEVVVRADSAQEIEYLASGGILPFVLRELAVA